jgi:pyruvate kinase
MIRTKIVATLGPACNSVDALLRLFEAGVDVCRLNFSHGTLDAHLKTLKMIREAASQTAHPIAVLGDLCGPKIRVGQVKDIDNTGGMPIRQGDELTIQRKPTTGDNLRISSTYDHLVDDVQVGDRVLIEDGLLRFVVIDKNTDELRLSATVAGVIKTGKGINLPHSKLNVPAITEKDWEAIEFAISEGIDYLAMSFVRRADEIQHVREHLRNRMSDIQLIAKIEKNEAISNIKSIIDAADGLMIARGDLGVEMDVAQVPIIQKDLIRKCQSAGKPVIVATQMLQSMIENSSPTRAEVSDVANAIFDGTDAVMLSGETSVGRFPAGAVLTMAHVAEVTEKYIDSVKVQFEPLKLDGLQMSVAVANGVRQMAADLKMKLVVVYSQTGSTARIFSKTRFPVPIIALSSDPRALRRMTLHYGVQPQEMAPPKNIAELIEQVDQLLCRQKYAQTGDRIVIVAGSSLGTPGALNSVVLHTVGEQTSMPVQVKGE